MDRTTVHMFTRKRPIGPALSGDRAAYAYLKDMSDLDRETFVTLVLNARNQVLAKELISVGTLSSSIVHPREVFRPAIVAGGAAIVIAHNHPSGDKTPSCEDLDVTRRLVRAGELIGIRVLDHLIIAGNEFCGLFSQNPDLFAPTAEAGQAAETAVKWNEITEEEADND